MLRVAIQGLRSLGVELILIRMDSAFDAAENYAMAQVEGVDFLVKGNPAHVRWDWLKEAEALSGRAQTRTGRNRRETYLSRMETREFEGKLIPVRRILKITQRPMWELEDVPPGQRLLLRRWPKYEMGTWVTSLDLPGNKLFDLYCEHATAEQHHAEIKSELDLERVPSGTFKTNALVLGLGISPRMQVKLLRAIQQREVRRVGENTVRPVNVRVLSAINRDLAGLVARGAFCQDLYYRLRVVELQISPLRTRRDDILPLARVLLADAAKGMGRLISGFSPAVADHLLRHPWLGNVRELANAMERAAALAPGDRVELEDLPEEIRSMEGKPPADKAMVRPLEGFKKEYILTALERNGGNQTRTAEQLRIGPATLLRKLKRYGHGGSAKAPPGRPRRSCLPGSASSRS